MNNIETYLIIIFLVIILIILLKDVLIEKYSSPMKLLFKKYFNNDDDNDNNDDNDDNETYYNSYIPNRLVNNSMINSFRINQNDTLDRYYNPMRFPYKKHEQYYPNMNLPPQVIGCGSRNTPCLGGSQIPVIATSNMLDFTNTAIAPINIRTRGPEGIPQQVGTIYKLRSANSEVLPLFGRKKYPNGDNNWEYYTLAGDHGVKLKIFTKKRGEQLGTNDIVYIKGYNRFPYRVTMYDYDFLQYIPY